MKKFKWPLIVIISLLVLRALLPMICLKVINAELGKRLGTYEGHITDFDLTLYRGAYQIQGLVIQKKGSADEPILKIAEIDLSLAWRALLQKRIAADVTLKKPQVHLVDSQQKQNRQLATEEPKKNWRSALKVLIPMTIESLKVSDGQVAFVNRDLRVPLPVMLDQIELQARDLRLQKTEEKSPLRFSARLQRKAKILVTGRVALLAEKRLMDIDFELLQFPMNSINQVLRAYIPLDITQGILSIYGEAVSDQKEMVGYAKVFFKNGDIIAPKQKYFNFRHFAFEMISAFGNWLLQNQKDKSVETVIPFHYKNGKWDINASQTFWSTVKNSKTGLKPGIDHRLSLQSLEQRKD